MTQAPLLKGTVAHYEAVDRAERERISKGELVFLNMPLPGGCNYNCPKCFSGGSDTYLQQLRNRGITPSFPKELRRKLIEDASALGIRTIVIAGAGEPLLYPNLEELIRFTKDQRLHTILFTNGSHLTAKRAQALFSNGISIVFSYDANTPQNYDTVTGTRGNHEVVKTNLENALRLSEDFTKQEEGFRIVSLAVNTNPTRFTYNPAAGTDEIREIQELISGRAAHFVSHPTYSGNAITNWEFLTGQENGLINPKLMGAVRIYGNALGGSSRREDGFCAYVYNGVTIYEGHYMLCPNKGLASDFGQYPQTSIERHFEHKKRMLQESLPLCITRKNKDYYLAKQT
jgi:MoaA/NifB/PqqE/SkfB family radical SAM enzyme